MKVTTTELLALVWELEQHGGYFEIVEYAYNTLIVKNHYGTKDYYHFHADAIYKSANGNRKRYCSYAIPCFDSE